MQFLKNLFWEYSAICVSISSAGFQVPPRSVRQFDLLAGRQSGQSGTQKEVNNCLEEAQNPAKIQASIGLYPHTTTDPFTLE